MCFGRFYDELTRQTLEQIATLGSKLRIADFGAGTGRLSLPLAAAGHTVSAVEPSASMLANSANSSRRVSTMHKLLRSCESSSSMFMSAF
jgi:predicted RNA methylase